MSLTAFDPKELRSITALCLCGEIPLSVRTVRELCRRDRFPHIKKGGQYFTTHAWVRQYFYSGANAAARKISA
jgi:hypothetical protein